MIEAKHTVKRFIARTCFGIEVFIIIVLALSWFLGDANTAKNIEASTGLLATILTGFNLIIMLYMGISEYSDQKAGGRNDIQKD